MVSASGTDTPTRKIISLMHISLDGFAAGPNGELEWAVVDEEIHADVAAMLTTVDTALYGRITYQMMESFWPTVPANPDATEFERQHSRWIEDVRKIVFSRTLDRVTGNNTRLIKERIAEEAARLKQQPGNDMMIFGSPSIVHELTRHGMIDEYRINLDPIVLGGGVPLFPESAEPIRLNLLEAKTFRSGVVGLRYRRVREGEQ